MAFWSKFSSNPPLLLVILVCFHAINYQVECSANGSCNFYEGSWVFDDTPPLYISKTCPFINKGFDCQKNGRPDSDYLKYRWQPSTCNLSRFNGLDFLQRYRGKHIMFVGDSLGVDQFDSLACILYNSAPNLKYNFTNSHDGELLKSSITLLDYDLKVTMDLNHFFVDIISTPNGKILNLDSIQDGKNWLGVDTLVFNTWHWWPYTKPGQPWDYVQDGEQIWKDIDRIYAFKRGLTTWARWIDANIDTNKTKVFFQGISPNHYAGTEWGKPYGNCGGEKTPISGCKYPGPYSTQPGDIIKSTLATMRIPVTYLDITTLSLLRIDGHPSYYDGLNGQKGTDCTHWCLAGVPIHGIKYFTTFFFRLKNEML